jgi:glyoxylase-like metal-dependent hydrolase (beta-lactamase superfamily II)
MAARKTPRTNGRNRRSVAILAAIVMVTVAVGTLAAIAQASLPNGLPTPAASAQAATKPEPTPTGEGWWTGILPRPEWKDLPIVQLPPSCSWFEVHKVGSGIYALYENGQWQEVMSYLFIGQKKALLFDTGMDIGNIKQCVDKLTSLPVTVVLSHTHPDHVAGAWQFKNVWAMDSDYARANQAGMTHAQAADMVPADSIWKPPPGRFDIDTYAIKPFKVTRWLHEGDKIDLGNRKLEVLATPGHSPDGLSLLDRANRLLFVGDVFYNSDLYAHLAASNLADYTATAAKLAALVPDVDYIFPAHNISHISSIWLTKMNDAFQAIKNGTATDYTDYGNVRVFNFGYFRIDVRISDLPE